MFSNGEKYVGEFKDGEYDGKRIVDVPAPDLVKQGYILEPKVRAKKYNCGFYQSTELIDKEVILDALKNEDHMTKVLVTAKSTTNIHKLLTKTDFMAICHEMRYNVIDRKSVV